MSRQLKPSRPEPRLRIVWQNSYVVVVDKPAGWLSVPSRMGAADGRPCVGIALQEQLGARLWPVHRLDEEVSGLLVFARTAEAHRLLCRGFEAHEIEKTYLARCEGKAPSDTPLDKSVRLTTTLLRGKRRAYVHERGKLAITDVKLLSAEEGQLRFELHPRTGRPHQLRVELARRGCPIVGDALYGAKTPFQEGGIALRAFSLGFEKFADSQQLELPQRVATAPEIQAPA